MIGPLFIVANTVVLLGTFQDNQTSWGPWSVSERAPVVDKVTDHEPARPVGTPFPSVTAPFLWTIRFFQKYVSPADGPRCTMYPTCSQYGYLAFKKHGPIMGLFMAADRLMRDNISADEFYPVRNFYGTLRYYDPVEDNDFWWNSPRGGEFMGGYIYPSPQGSGERRGAPCREACKGKGRGDSQP